MGQKASGLRVGVYVDVENIARNGGRGMRFDVLRDYACRDGAEDQLAWTRPGASPTSSIHATDRN
jgi:hypothetical protein